MKLQLTFESGEVVTLSFSGKLPKSNLISGYKEDGQLILSFDDSSQINVDCSQELPFAPIINVLAVD